MVDTYRDMERDDSEQIDLERERDLDRARREYFALGDSLLKFSFSQYTVTKPTVNFESIISDTLEYDGKFIPRLTVHNLVLGMLEMNYIYYI